MTESQAGPGPQKGPAVIPKSHDKFVQEQEGMRLINSGLRFDLSDVLHPGAWMVVQGLQHRRISSRLQTIDLELRARYHVRKNKPLPPEAQAERDRLLAITVVRKMGMELETASGTVALQGSEPRKQLQATLENEFFPPDNPNDPEGADHFHTRFLDIILACAERVDEIDPLLAWEKGSGFLYGSRDSIV